MILNDGTSNHTYTKVDSTTKDSLFVDLTRTTNSLSFQYTNKIERAKKLGSKNRVLSRVDSGIIDSADKKVDISAYMVLQFPTHVEVTPAILQGVVNELVSSFGLDTGAVIIQNSKLLPYIG